jgi:hypothetical protein
MSTDKTKDGTSLGRCVTGNHQDGHVPDHPKVTVLGQQIPADWAASTKSREDWGIE